MADSKISALNGGTSLTGAALADGDLFVVVDVSDTSMAATGTNKPITRANLETSLMKRVAPSYSSNAYTVTDTLARLVANDTSLTAAVTITLPAANAVPAGAQIVVADESGSVTATNTISIKPAGSDTVDGVAAATNFPIIREPYGSFTFRSNGNTKWTVTDRKPVADVQIFTSSANWLKPFGVRQAKIVLIGGGGGGGGGCRNSTDAYGGGGGYGGAVTIADTVPLVDLGATESVTVGAAGTGGAGRQTSAGSGTAGTAGGSTTFSSSSKWVAQGGPNGAGATQTSGGTFGTGAGNGLLGSAIAGVGGGGGGAPQAGCQGGIGTSLGSTYGLHAFITPGAGGGGGGFTSSGSVVVYGGNGGNSAYGVGTNSAGLAGGVASGSNGGNGGAGASCTTITTNSIFGGAGGAGGNGHAQTGVGGRGGAGGNYGGGGGGGAGGSLANGNSGGDGGAGAAYVVCT